MAYLIVGIEVLPNLAGVLTDTIDHVVAGEGGLGAVDALAGTGAGAAFAGWVAGFAGFG